MDYDENAININDILQYDLVAFELKETSILFPWGKSRDKYFLLDDLFLKKTNSNLLFHEIRDNLDGKYLGRKIEDKYATMEKRLFIPSTLSDELKKEELDNELITARKRYFVWNIYHQLKQQEKTILFIVDDEDDIEIFDQILRCNDYDKYKTIIKKKDVYDSLTQCLEQGKRILVIGRENYINDNRCGYIYIPETAYVLGGEYNKDISINNAIYRAAGNMVYVPNMIQTPGYSIMLKIVANHFFDNPFVEWRAGADFNCNSSYVGYYALGMHLVGIIKWLVDSLEGMKYNRILFCARDGLLIKEAYDIYRRYNPQLPKSEYIQASRKLLLPQLIKSKGDLYNIPGVNYGIYSPYTVMLLLWQFTNIAPLYDYRHEFYHDKEEIIVKKIEQAGYSYKKEFESQEELDGFIDFYIDTFYDECKHKTLLENVREYYRKYSKDDILFDLGYSGKLPKAIVECSSGINEVRYIYSDEENSELMSRVGNFSIKCFYNFRPIVDNVLREYILSENGPSCLGLKKVDDELIPVFEVDVDKYCTSDVIKDIQQSALEFVQDVYDLFKEKWMLIPFKGQEASMPFEGFIREIGESDLEMFANTYQENYNTGEKSQQNWAEYYRGLMKGFPKTVICDSFGGGDGVEKNDGMKVSVVITTYNRKYEVARALRSVLAQTVQPYEIIIVDDGSTDGTREYLKEQIQVEYKYIYNVNAKGPGRSRNIGIISAGGDFVAFLDSDNEWYANKLERFQQVYAENPNVDIICSRYKKHIEFEAFEYPGSVVSDNISMQEEILLHNFADASATIYRKTFLETIDGFNESMKTNIDWELLLRASAVHLPRINKIQDILSENWEMDDGVSSNHELEVSERLSMLADYWKDVTDSDLRTYFFKQFVQDHKENPTDYLQKIAFYKWVNYDRYWMEFEHEASVETTRFLEKKYDVLEQEFIAKEEQIRRKGNFYMLLFHWLQARQSGVTIANVLEEKSIQTVAIYGMGRHGRLVLEDLHNSKITVKFILDRNPKIEDTGEIEVLDISLNYPKVDAIIISPFLEFETIAEFLREKSDAKLLSLQDLVTDAFEMAKEKLDL